MKLALAGRVVPCWAVLLALGLPSCADPDPRPCVLVVTLDTLRADAVSAWGGRDGTTPVLDDLARRGVRFADCTTVTPLTLPAHASLFSGLRPARHGLTVNGVSAPPFAAPLLAEQMSAAGWTTGAFVSASILDHRHGLDEGFAHYDDHMHRPDGPPMPHERRGDHTVDEAVAWLEEADGPWLAWVHLYDPHAPYAAPGAEGDPPADDEDPWPAYLREVAFTDAQLGRLVEAARACADGELLVVVTSDHGEGLGEHGEATHGVLIHETTMHVPLVMTRLDGDDATTDTFPRQGVVRDDTVSLLDVTPTLLEVLGLPVAAGLDGRSVVEPRPGRLLPLESAIPEYYYGFSPLAGVRRDRLKLSGAPRADPPGWALVDLDDDPHELAPRAPDADDPLLRAIPSTDPVVDARLVTGADELAALGYMGPGGGPDDAGPRRDPREAMELVVALNAANRELVDGDARQAYARLAPLRTTWGDVPELRLFLGKALRALGRHPEAHAELSLGVALNPSSTDLRLEWAKVLLEQAAARLDGTPTAALEQLDHVDRLAPGHPDVVTLRALAEVEFGDAARALELLAPALAERPRATNLLAVRMRALAALGRTDDAQALADELGLELP